MSERQIEMLWPCSSCGHKNLGRFTECQGCRNPKDGSEELEMPSDTASAPSVEDPELLKLAKAGAHWRCAFCGSDQRAHDGKCLQCGAGQDTGKSLDELEPAASTPASPPTTPRVPSPPVPLSRYVGFGVAAAVLVAGAMGVLWLLNRPDDLEAVVSTVAWEHRLSIEKYQLVPNEGFAETRPASAVDVASLGPRVHHHEDVFDHYETVHYTEEERDGYRSESYTEQESCGQTCTSRPKSCHESCKSNKNGFATCKTTCSGGGQSCSTKYCSRTRTRQVPKYRTVNKTRQEARTRSEPRYAEAFRWREWAWRFDRVVKASGRTTQVRWPTEAEVRQGAKLLPGEQERSTKEATYEVSLATTTEPESHTYTRPVATGAEFAGFAVGSLHVVRVKDGQVLAVDPPRE